MEVGVLGVCRVERAGEPVDLPARKLRSVLAALALELGTTVSADRLIDLVWNESAPRGAHGTLHSYISGLRRVLEPELPARARPRMLVTSDGGYRLVLDRSEVDATAFTDEVRLLHRHVAPLESQLSNGPQADWPDRNQATASLEAVETALLRWRGQAYADLGDHPQAIAARTGLDELRTTAEEDRALLMLALGDPAGVVAETEQATTRNPFRERTWAVHALALVRSGRQADALATIRRLREALADELGLDPGPSVRTLESAILRQDEEILRSLPAAPSLALTPSRVSAETEKVTPWQTIGRATERRALDETLAAALEGHPSIAVLVGDPGLGKSRLLADLAAVAAAQGLATLSGSCSADDGAPPLWPWQAMLAEIDLAAARERLATEDATDYAQRAFAVSDLIAGAVRERAAQQPVLLVVDDLHWADEPTLRALSHLVATARDGERLAVVVTWRPWPEPTGALADLEVTAARHGARRLQLSGLPAADAAALVSSVAGPDTVSPAQVDAWWAATDGNPFFLVELARLATEHGGWNGEVPVSVQAVVRRRLEHLQSATQDLLVVAAALGQEFSVMVLAAALSLAPEVVDEQLDAARDAGIVRDRDGGVLAFEHPLTRDAALASVRPSRRARTHAKIAYAYERPDAPVPAATRPFELARHWLAAGPVHAARAWPAAAQAARLATAAFAHDEAVDLYRAALAAQRLDPQARGDDRFALLLSLAEVAAYAGIWQHVVASAVEAIGIAAAADDPSGVARAAAEVTRHSIWTPQEFGEVNGDLIDDLRRALDQTGGGDSVERVRLSLALACQLYYADERASEALALVDQGTAMAERIGDLGLIRWTARSASIGLWRSAYVDRRRALVERELAAARELGDLDAEALALTTATGIALELGDRDGYRHTFSQAARLARRRRLGYLRIALGCVELTLAALSDSAELSALSIELAEVSRQTSVVNHDAVVSSLSFLTLLWDRDAPADHLDALVAAVSDGSAVIAVEAAGLGLVRLGRLRDAAALLQQVPLEPLIDTWSVTWDAAARAEIAAALDDRAIAEPAAAVLRRYSGRLATGGVSIVAGPVDGYLALAEATLGRRSAATAAADRGLEQARAWEMAAYVRWLEQHRVRGGW